MVGVVSSIMKVVSLSAEEKKDNTDGEYTQYCRMLSGKNYLQTRSAGIHTEILAWGKCMLGGGGFSVIPPQKKKKKGRKKG